MKKIIFIFILLITSTFCFAQNKATTQLQSVPKVDCLFKTNTSSKDDTLVAYDCCDVCCYVAFYWWQKGNINKKSKKKHAQS